MKILVTGLCLSRNLGGPAIGLTLMKELNKRFDNLEFTFAITATSYDIEKVWAEKYHVNIVRKDRLHIHLLDKLKILWLLRYFTFKGLKLSAYIPSKTFWKDVHQEFLEAITDSDLVIDINGVSYVGDGTKNFFEGLEYYTNFHYCKQLHKPFARFVQSFGPFNDWKVRFFAKREFAELDFVPARGKISAELCRQIVRDKAKVYDFPDIAILLPHDEKWGNTYLEQKVHVAPKNYVILSPSAVIYRLPNTKGKSIGEEHVRSYYLIAKKFLEQQEDIIFLPHMYSEKKSDCDREICFKTLELLRADHISCSHVHVITDPIDAMQAKALIALSKFAIVSRYHALVAAVSTSIPVITIGWNVKYQDLLDYYGLSDFALDTRKYSANALAQRVFEKMKLYHTSPELVGKMKTEHEDNINKVQRAFDVLENWIRTQKL